MTHRNDSIARISTDLSGVKCRGTKIFLFGSSLSQIDQNAKQNSPLMQRCLDGNKYREVVMPFLRLCRS
jgi:hypothetical protein